MSRNSQAIIGQDRLIADALPSTHAHALDMLSKTNPTGGTVIFTWNQTAGRGQIGRSWHSEAGKNCCFSVILRPGTAAREQFYLNIAFALAMRETIARYIDPPVLLKWPNDLVTGHRKIGGVLIQNTIQGTAIQATVASAGINVNQREFPKSLPNPVSIAQLTDGEHDILEVLDTACSTLDMYYRRLLDREYNGLHEEYLSWLYGFMENRHFRLLKDNTGFEGRISGVDSDGHLLVETSQGTASFKFREIQMQIT